MGCFTTIIHENKNYQIKCGNDICETYKLGDKVEQWFSKYTPNSGYLLDDVYDGFGGSTLGYIWIIIKDSTIFAIEPFTDNDFGDYNLLREKYQIQTYADDCWPKSAWQNKKWRDIRHKKENEEFENSIKDKTDDEKLAARLIRPFFHSMMSKSLYEKIFKIEPLTEQQILDLNKNK